MTNTTDKSILTAAGKALLAQLNAEEKPLVIDKMIFANVPSRPEFPQPDDVVPSDDVVHEAAVEQRGRLSVDSVIYSTTLTSQEGPFEFNWTGAYCSEYGVLVTIDHHALTPKTVDEPGVSGNTLVRSVVLEYKDIAEITNITVDASTWQYNATPRMKKMDDDVAQAIIDQNGKDWFIEDGFLATPQASAFNIKAGAGYVSGNRVTLEFDRNVQVPNKPSFIYVDAHREGTPTGEQVTLFDFVITAEEKDDYTDANGVKHFVCKIAQVLADGSVSDLRAKNASMLWAISSDSDTADLATSSKIFRDKHGKIIDIKQGHHINEGIDAVSVNGVLHRLKGDNRGQVKKIQRCWIEFHDGTTVYHLDTRYPSNNVKAWHAAGDNTTDDFEPVQLCIFHNDKIEFPVSKYLITKSLDCTNRFGGLSLIGEHTGIANNGSVLVGETGTSALVDTAGTQKFFMDSLGIAPGVNNPTLLGVLLARSRTSQYAQFNKLSNCRIDVASDPTAFNGYGSVPVYNIAAEICTFADVYGLGDNGCVIASKNILGVQSEFQDLTGAPSSCSTFRFEGNTVWHSRSQSGAPLVLSGCAAASGQCYVNGMGEGGDLRSEFGIRFEGINKLHQLTVFVEFAKRVAFVDNGFTGNDIIFAGSFNPERYIQTNDGFTGITSNEIKFLSTISDPIDPPDYWIKGEATDTFSNNKIVAPVKPKIAFIVPVNPDFNVFNNKFEAGKYSEYCLEVLRTRTREFDNPPLFIDNVRFWMDSKNRLLSKAGSNPTSEFDGASAGFGSGQHAVGTEGTASALPNLPLGYAEVVIDGTEVLVPYYRKP